MKDFNVFALVLERIGTVEALAGHYHIDMLDLDRGVGKLFFRRV